MLWSVEKNGGERKMSLFRGSKSIVLIGLILLAASGALAEPTGKIVGKVTDAKTGEGLPGANVRIENTKCGACSDLDGSFTIINVPVGMYNVEATFIGFKRSRTKGVSVVQNQTTIQDFKLEIERIGIPTFDLANVEGEPQQIESSQLKGTIITPHMEQKIPKEKNVLYCSTMQLAWNALADDIIKERIRLEGNPPVVKAMNKRLSSRKDLSEESYVAMAEWLTEEFLQRLNKTLKEKFGDQAPPEVKEPIPTGPPMFLAYAYLFKNLVFNKPFELLPDELLFISGSQYLDDYAIAFGIDYYKDEEKYREMGKQVKVVEYLDDNHFIIELQSKSENDQILLAKVKPGNTLLETIEEAEKKAKGGYSAQPHLRKGETLRIPVLNFYVKHSFSELSGKKFANNGKENWEISKAIQWIRFKLNQKGALLKSEARIVGIGASAPPPNYIPPRQFIFDKPFLICLKQKGARYPYFAMWVGNTELMVKAN
jgi:hypothetical protein